MWSGLLAPGLMTRQTDEPAGPVFGPAPFPLPIRLSVAAELFLTRVGEALVKGDLEYLDLPPSLRALWTFAFEEGRRHSPAQQLRDDNERLYREMCRRTPPKTPDYIPHSELERRRAQPGRTPTEPARTPYNRSA